MIDFVQVGRKLAALRNQAQISQEDMANYLYVTRQAVSKWENGTSVPSIDCLLQMAKLLEVSFEELLCLDDEKTEIDPQDPFGAHDRAYVIEQFLQRKVDLPIAEFLLLCQPNERLQILKAIRDKRFLCNRAALMPYLSVAEQAYIRGGK